MDNIGIKPDVKGGQGKVVWLRRKLDAAVRHLRDIEDFNRIWDGPPGTYEGSFEEAQADRARSIYEQITSDFYEGKLGQPTMRQERDAAIARAETAERQADKLRIRAIDGFTRIRNLAEGNSNYTYDLANSALRAIEDVIATPEPATETGEVAP